MKIQFNGELHQSLELLLNQCDREYSEEIYTSYEACCNQIGYEKEDQEVFSEMDWKKEDDLTNLFKLLAIYGDDFYELDYWHGEIPCMLMRQYTEEENNNILYQSEEVKFNMRIPLWIFDYSILFLRTFIDHVAHNDMLDTTFYFLSHYSKKYWKDETLCPEWGEKEETIFEDFCGCLIETKSGTNVHALNIVDEYELCGLFYERVDLNIESSRRMCLDILFTGAHKSRIIILELENIKKMERNQERNKKMIKLLRFIERTKIGKDFLRDLFKIISNNLEELEIREMAINITTKYVYFGMEDLIKFALLCGEGTHKSIRKIAFAQCCKINKTSTYEELTFEDSKDISQLLTNAIVHFEVESVEDASNLFNFIYTHNECLIHVITERNFFYIINRATKFIHEMSRDRITNLADIMDLITNSHELITRVATVFMKGLENYNDIPAIVVARFAKVYADGLSVRSSPKLGVFAKYYTDQFMKESLDFVTKYLKDRDFFPDELSKVVISTRIYHDMERIDPTRSNLDYFFIEALEVIPSSYLALISILAEYILLDLPIPDREKSLESIKNFVTERVRQVEIISLFIGIFALIDNDLAKNLFTLTHGDIIVSSHLVHTYSGLIQYGLLKFLNDLLDLDDNHKLKIESIGVVQDELINAPFIRSLFSRVAAKHEVVDVNRLLHDLLF